MMHSWSPIKTNKIMLKISVLLKLVSEDLHTESVFFDDLFDSNFS